MMNRGEFYERKGTGSVKPAIRVYGDRIFGGSSSLKKPQMDMPEMTHSKTRELHKVKREIGRYKETSSEAEILKGWAESELRDAKDTARDLSSLLRDSRSNTKARKQEINVLRRSTKREKRADSGENEHDKYEEVMRELEAVKQELRMLKLDMAAVLEEKSRADKQIEGARMKVVSCSSSLEAIRKEIEEANDEQVVVELARIEALRECGEIEAERAKEAVRFSHAIEQTRRKMKDIVDEIEQSTELEPKLAVTLADIDVLKHELRQVKEMEKRVRSDESEHSRPLQSVTEELEAAKRELASVKEEGFQCMASMDVIRNELRHVKSEIARLEETEKSSDSAMQSLNLKLLRAKAKLEAVSAAEERAASIVSNLTHTLEQLKTDAEAAKEERVLVLQEAGTIKAEVRKAESETDATEENLEAAMKELEAAKASEYQALENLKTRIEKTVGSRSNVLQHSSSISISKFEYEYLTGRAVGAEDLAAKKVAAAKAWIEAIKANEKEIMMKIDLVQREMREMRLEEEREAYKMERSFSAKRTVEREMQSWRTKREKNPGPDNFQLGMHKRSVRGNAAGNLTPSRRPKSRASGSPGGRSSFPVKKKRQVLPDLAKFFKAKAKKEKNVV